MRAGAVFDPTGAYRYVLWRRWDAFRPGVTFVMLNPSTADADRDDPTIRRCLGFARAWGFGGLLVVNLFALRAASPRTLRTAPDPIGPRNDGFLARAARDAHTLIVAWGDGGVLGGRGEAVLRRLPQIPFCLGTTRAGQPRHPLYLPARAVPVPLHPQGLL
jgi:hypothetical protein